jgi:hypothetical protein
VEAFTPFNELTEDKVITWLTQNLSMESLQNSLIRQIEDQINPPILNLPPPWNVPSPTPSETITPTPTITPTETPTPTPTITPSSSPIPEEPEPLIEI